MPAIEVGRLCVKLTGREAGGKCVIVDVLDRKFVLVTGPKAASGLRRRRANVSHLEPLDKKIEIKRDSTDEEVLEALKKAGFLDSMSELVRPSLPTV